MQAGKAAASGDAGRPLQFTMKKGYEVLRDPHLNKVGAGSAGALRRPEPPPSARPPARLRGPRNVSPLGAACGAGAGPDAAGRRAASRRRHLSRHSAHGAPGPACPRAATAGPGTGVGQRVRGSLTSCGPGDASSTFGAAGSAAPALGLRPASPGPGARSPPRVAALAPRYLLEKQLRQPGEDAAGSYAALLRVNAAVSACSGYPPSFPSLFPTGAPPCFLRASLAVCAVLTFISWQVEKVFCHQYSTRSCEIQLQFPHVLPQRMQSALKRCCSAAKPFLSHL